MTSEAIQVLVDEAHALAVEMKDKKTRFDTIATTLKEHGKELHSNDALTCTAPAWSVYIHGLKGTARVTQADETLLSEIPKGAEKTLRLLTGDDFDKLFCKVVTYTSQEGFRDRAKVLLAKPYLKQVMGIMTKDGNLSLTITARDEKKVKEAAQPAQKEVPYKLKPLKKAA